MKREKAIGILGGMGPEATIDLFQKIVKLTPAQQDQDHLKIIIFNNPKIPDRTKAILHEGENPLPELIKTAQELEKAGADFIIMPCNTAHYYHQEIQKAVDITILNMIQETVIYIHQTFPQIRKVSVFATIGTNKTGLYQKHLNEFSIEALPLTENEQGQIMEIIYGVKAGQDLKQLKKRVLEIAKLQTGKGTEAIIAGCTEIPLVLKDGNVEIPVIDPTLIVAQKAIAEATP